MALLAESLVEEWLNRNGFFTIRGIHAGVDELDLLAVCPKDNGFEARHVEVQMSVNPISYIAPLTEEQSKLYGRGKRSAWRRPPEALPVSVAAWVIKKFTSATKIKARNRAWPNLQWSFFFIHGKVRHPEELALIRSFGIEIVCFYDVLTELCVNKKGAPKSSAGSDISDMISYYETFRHQKT